MNKTALHDDHCTCMCAADAYGKKKEIGEIPNESFFAHLLIENRFFFKSTNLHKSHCVCNIRWALQAYMKVWNGEQKREIVFVMAKWITFVYETSAGNSKRKQTERKIVNINVLR